MKPVELRTILKKLNLSRGGFAILLGMSRRAGEMWASDETERVPGVVATWARLLDSRPELVTWLTEHRRQHPP